MTSTRGCVVAVVVAAQLVAPTSALNAVTTNAVLIVLRIVLISLPVHDSGWITTTTAIVFGHTALYGARCVARSKPATTHTSPTPKTSGTNDREYGDTPAAVSKARTTLRTSPVTAVRSLHPGYRPTRTGCYRNFVTIRRRGPSLCQKVIIAHIGVQIPPVQSDANR